MLKRLHNNQFLRIYLRYITPLILLTALVSFIIYKQDIRTFHAVMENNEKQILYFQEMLIKEHLLTLKEDISYLVNFQLTKAYVESDFSKEISLFTVFKSFLERKKVYSSLRIIDKDGNERLRMNYADNLAIMVKEKDLQSKSNRYYFNEIMNMNPEDIYYSPLDFNYEDGVIQYPYKPVIRVAKLFPQNNGRNTAFIILNYMGNDVLKLIDESSFYSFGRLFLQNKNGLIISLDEKLSGDKIIISDFLKTSDGINFLNASSNQKDIRSGFISHKKINISDNDMNTPWNLISFVNAAEINFHTRDEFKRLIFIFLLLSTGSAILSYFATKNKLIRNNANQLIEERARIFDLNPAPVLKVSESGEILSSNSAAKSILGLSASSSSIYNIFNNLSREKLDIVKSNNFNNFEYLIGGKIYYFTSIKENQSKKLFFYGTDISENFKIREELKNFKTAVQQSANVIVFTDLEGRILFANDAFETVTGYSNDEVINKKPTVLQSGYHDNNFYKELWDTITDGRVWAGEFYNKRKDGSFFWEKSTISPVLSKEGEPKFFIAVKEDITEKKLIEIELKTQTQYAEAARINAEKAKNEAESANLLKSSFLANMSHEIRTPMNAILGFTRLLLENKQDEKDREKLNIILTSGENLLSLINDILDFSKIEANQVELHSVKINLSLLFAGIEDLFEIQIKSKSLKYKTIFAQNVPDIVFGDENRIRQILINIIGNAIKFTDDGEILVNVEWTGLSLVTSITDSGIGIEEEKLEDIFSPFKQSDSAMDRKYEGTGLGLAISRKMTELMGGTVLVESTPGHGSTFTIIIPLENSKKEQLISGKDKLEISEDFSSKSMVENWLKKTNDDKVLHSIVKDAIVSLPRQLGRLERVIRSKDLDELLAVSHELMGSTGNMGMTEVFEILKEINTLAQKNKPDFFEIEKYFNTLEKLVSNIPEEYMQEFASELLPINGDSIDVNVLTADDSPINRQLIGAMLSSIFIRSDFAEDGVETLIKLSKKKYDILLLDIQMPKLDGLETIKKIRSDKRYEDLHVIAVTANAMQGDAQKYLDHGCNDYISKPISKDIFIKKIEHQIQKIATKQVIFPEKGKHDFSDIIGLLEKEVKLFNPGRVKNIAEQLEIYSTDEKIKNIIKKLNNSALLFDSKGLTSIIQNLRELM